MKKGIILPIILIGMFVLMLSCSNETAKKIGQDEDEIQNIINYVEQYYLSDDFFLSKYPDFKIDSVEIIPENEYDNIRIDGTISLSIMKMHIITGIDSTWLEYITKNQAILVRATYSYTMTEEQMASGPLYSAGTYFEYAVLIKDENNKFKIIDNTAPQ